MHKLIVFSDGGSRGNPGSAAVGVVICNEQGQILKKYGEAIGEATNNEAEYQALIFALKKIKLLYGKSKTKKLSIACKLDSELVVKQLNHQYKITEKNIQRLFIKVWNLMLDFEDISFEHVAREQNQQADDLVNQALDQDAACRSLPGLGA